ncbi:DNA polymerase V [Methylophilus rhizosphaerae]|uniref:DNA polymerase V n=1 Tax=Methylophilus rhizosphaerae TaxID=492660 RepID=A0A1G9A869_9PROT|nr:translesion error-prone DNA polymerase V autoproteolytic subunit [Methylophilus rhizosphaerae]SDK22650.1 DNA polymerase V [Methylophilus rhizosphaerae]
MGNQLPPSVILEIQNEFLRLFPERNWNALGWPQFNEEVPGIGVFINNDIDIELNLYSSSVSAGFPSPASDHIEERLKIDKYLIKNENSSFYAKVGGYSMVNAGLNYGAMAVVDRQAIAKIGSRVLAVVDGQFTMKILNRASDGFPLLMPANEGFKPIHITEFTSFELWGVITGTFHRFND